MLRDRPTQLGVDSSRPTSILSQVTVVDGHSQIPFQLIRYLFGRFVVRHQPQETSAQKLRTRRGLEILVR